MDEVIKTRGLSVSARNNVILDSLDLDIYRNKVNTILGPSGSGKSTLIRTINRLTDLNGDFEISGTVYFNDHNIQDMSAVELRRKIGMVFQSPNPFWMSIYDNVAFGPRLHGSLPRLKLDEIVKRSLTEAGLYQEVERDLARSAMKLSGGQQQRMCIARALAVEPEVIMLDEPTSSLDPISKSKIEDLMSTLKEKYTVILVTHDISQAARVSDFVNFLYKGKVLEKGESKEMFENPRNEITEKFITGRAD